MSRILPHSCKLKWVMKLWHSLSRVKNAFKDGLGCVSHLHSLYPEVWGHFSVDLNYWRRFLQTDSPKVYFDSCQISELRKIVVTQIISLLMPEKSLLASLSHSSQILLFEKAVRNAQRVHRPLHVWRLLGQSHRRTKVYLFSCSLFNIAPRGVRLIG